MNSSYKKVSLIVFTGIAISIITGCFNSNKGIPYYTISEDFADYCWFEEGSYWIFQNDSTLVTDSVRIDDVRESKRFNPVEVDYNYQAVEIFTTANVSGITQHELTAGDYETIQGEMNSLLRLHKDDGSYELVFSPQYAIGEEIILGDDIGLYTNIEIIESFELNGNTYNDVYHTRVIKKVGTNIEYNYWIAKNYSLIKSVSTINGQTTSISLQSANLVVR